MKSCKNVGIVCKIGYRTGYLLQFPNETSTFWHMMCFALQLPIFWRMRPGTRTITSQTPTPRNAGTVYKIGHELGSRCNYATSTLWDMLCFVRRFLISWHMCLGTNCAGPSDSGRAAIRLGTSLTAGVGGYVHENMKPKIWAQEWSDCHAHAVKSRMHVGCQRMWPCKTHWTSNKSGQN